MFKKIIALLLVFSGTMSFQPTLVGAKDLSIPGGWTLTVMDGCDASFEFDSEVFYEGESSLMVTKKTGLIGGIYASLYYPLSLERGKTYVYSFWAKAKDAFDVEVAFDFEYRQSLNPIGQTYDWMRFEFEYTHPSDNRGVNFHFLFNGSMKNLWLDNFDLHEKGASNGNLLGNPGFERDGGESSAVPTAAELTRRELLQNGKGTAWEAEAIFGLGKYAPVFRTDGITLDGQNTEWSDDKYAGITLPSQYSQVTKVAKWEDENDSSVWAKFAYDDKNFYIAAETTDDIQHIIASQDAWQGDSLQFVFSSASENMWTSFGAVHTAAGGQVFSFSNMPADGLAKVQIKTSYSGGKTFFEIALPWEILYGALPKDGFLFNFLINDSDGDGRTSFTQWRPGIGEGQMISEEFATMVLQDGNDCYAWLETSGSALQKDVPQEFNLFITNKGTAKSLTVTTPDETINIELAEKQSSVYIFLASFGELGDGILNVTLRENGGASQNIQYKVKVRLGEKYYRDEFEIFATKELPLLDKLFRECKKKKISTDYELVNLRVMDIFIEHGLNDLDNGNEDRAAYVLSCLRTLHEDTTNALNAYLAKKAKPLSVSKYVTSPAKIEGNTFYAKDSDGNLRPTYYVGFGHFDRARADIPIFPDMGYNIIQQERGPDNTVIKGQGGQLAANTSNIEWFVQNVLNPAGENNVSVSMLISPHNLPQWLIEEYPEVRLEGLSESPIQFLGNKIGHPKIKEAYEVHLRTVIPLVKDHPALHSICLTNEPLYNSALDFDTLLEYQSYLAELYKNDISKLNHNHGTNYTAFSEVELIDSQMVLNPSTELEILDKLPAFYDWMCFNERYFADWHQWMVDIIHELAPGLPLKTKIMPTIGEAENDYTRGWLKFGTDAEMFAEFSDINGNDAMAYYKNSYTTPGKLQWYDLQRSIKNVPIFNSEDHVIYDGDSRYPAEQVPQVAGDIWQGAIHGRGASAIWVWERTHELNGGFTGSIMHRPDVVAAVGRTTLDLNRLAYQVEALSNVKPNVGILYSNTARLYSNLYFSSMFRAYEASLFSGQPVRFLTEKMLAAGDVEEVKVLIIAGAVNVLPETLDAITGFTDAGGKILIIDEDSLSFNQYNQPLPAQQRQKIFENAVVMPSEGDDRYHIVTPEGEEIRDELLGILDSFDLNKIMLMEGDTPVYDVEWTWVVYKGELLLNICNYKYDEDKTVKLLINGATVGRCTELITNKSVDTEELTLKTNVPMLLKVKMEKIKL